MKTIALIANTSWNLYNFRLPLMKALKEEGYKVVAIAPKDEYSIKLVEHGFGHYDIYIDNSGTNPLNDLKTTLRLYRLLKKIKPFIVLSFTVKPNIYGNIDCKLLGIKTVNNITGLGSVFMKDDFLVKIVKLLYKYALSTSSKVFFQNKDDLNLFLKEMLVDKNKCDLLPGSGIDVGKFIPQNRPNNDGIFKFLLLSRMLWDKGIGEYIDAARIIRAKYPKVKFYLLGFLEVDNPTAISKEQMDAWAREGVVEYLGVTDKVFEEIAKVDCVVLPSYYREGVSHALLEAASMEKPIITTDTIGCREVVDDGVNGFLCRVKDAKDLADKIEKMINLTQEKRIAMGKAGREKMIKEFDIKIVIKKYLEAIKEIEHTLFR